MNYISETPIPRARGIDLTPLRTTNACVQLNSHNASIALVCRFAVTSALMISAFFAVPAVAIEVGSTNIVTGNCSSLSARVSSEGVIDARGNHPGRPGNTHVTVAPTSPRYQIKYKPGPNGGACAFATVRLAMSVSSVSTRLGWEPDSANAASCQAQRKKWIADVTSHEAGHVADNTRIRKSYNRAVKPTKYEACASTQADADSALQSQVQEAIDHAILELSGQIQRASDEYHAANGEKIDNPNCCTQLLTYCPCNDPGSGKPRNYSTETECAERCPTGLSCFSSQCTAPP
jgi:hypothetical protein